jgi:SAM-dependent methyltransferase
VDSGSSHSSSQAERQFAGRAPFESTSYLNGVALSSSDVGVQARILHELGYALSSESTILDFGCGDGQAVRQLRDAGLTAFGVDIHLTDERPFLRLIREEQPYRIPFPDGTFDVVWSNQVLEHVQNHEVALSEIWRVLKPGGVSLHVFPPRYRVIEPHTNVPLAGVLRDRVWLLFWASLGVRNVFQTGMSAGAVAEHNYKYLRAGTRYLTTKELQRVVVSRFGDITFAEKYFIKHSTGRSRYLYALVQMVPSISMLFSATHQRVVFFKK